MLDNNYLIYLIIAVLFFVLGWAGKSYLRDDVDMNQTEVQQEAGEEERISPFLFGVVEEINPEKSDEQEGEMFSAELDLSNTFGVKAFEDSAPIKTKEFEFKEGDTKIYEVETKNGDISEENRKEVGFSELKKNDEVAIRCAIPPKDIEELNKYSTFRASEILIIKKRKWINQISI